jgi:hypothetical protein
MPKRKREYAKKKGKAILYGGQIPMRILADGALDIHYIPPLRDLLKWEGKLVVELAELKVEPLENFQSDEHRQLIIGSRERSIEAVRRLIRKRRMSGP